MDGIHDLGGMHGFGAVDADADEAFHHDWERIVFAAFVGTLGQGWYNMDEFRHAIERMEPSHYLSAPYYEKWLTGIETLLTEKGVVDSDVLLDRIAAFEAREAEVPDRTDPDLADHLFAGMQAAYDAASDTQTPRFTPGDIVRVRNIHPEGHTRCPRYVRGIQGKVKDVRGTFSFPDAGAAGRDEAAPVYSVRFDPADVWGSDDAEADDIRVDLWEPYLVEDEQASGEPARATAVAEDIPNQHP